MIVKKPCAHSGCPRLAIAGERYCDAHKQTAKKRKQAIDLLRKSSCKRGYGRAWQGYRKLFLAEHPVCINCKRKGRIVLATVVDHIKPHRQDMTLFWMEGNHQALCKRCHDRKTASEDGGFGN